MHACQTQVYPVPQVEGVLPSLPLAEPLVLWSDEYKVVGTSTKNTCLKKSRCVDLQRLDVVTDWDQLWSVFAVRVAQTSSYGSLHIFRDGITPTYDDPHNSSGAIFKVTCNTVSATHEVLQSLTTAFILNRIPCHRSVNGLTLAKKEKTCMLKVWIRQSRDKASVDAIQGFINAETKGLTKNCQFCPTKYLLQTISRRKGERLAPSKSRSFAAESTLCYQETCAPEEHPLQATPCTLELDVNVSNFANLSLSADSTVCQVEGRGARGRALSINSELSEVSNNSSSVGSCISDEPPLVEEAVSLDSWRHFTLESDPRSGAEIPNEKGLAHCSSAECLMTECLMTESRYEDDWGTKTEHCLVARLRATAARCCANPAARSLYSTPICRCTPSTSLPADPLAHFG